MPGAMPRFRPLARRCARLITHLGGDTRAATAVEYGLIVALIVIAMIASFKEVANVTVSMWGNTHSRMANATGY